MFGTLTNPLVNYTSVFLPHNTKVVIQVHAAPVTEILIDYVYAVPRRYGRQLWVIILKKSAYTTPPLLLASATPIMARRSSSWNGVIMAVIN